MPPLKVVEFSVERTSATPPCAVPPQPSSRPGAWLTALSKAAPSTSRSASATGTIFGPVAVATVSLLPATETWPSGTIAFASRRLSFSPLVRSANCLSERSSLMFFHGTLISPAMVLLKVMPSAVAVSSSPVSCSPLAKMSVSGVLVAAVACALTRAGSGRSARAAKVRVVRKIIVASAYLAGRVARRTIAE